jgi:hypothetical protein
MTVPGPTLVFSLEPQGLLAAVQLARLVQQEAQLMYPALLVNTRTLHKMVFARDARQVTTVPALL